MNTKLRKKQKMILNKIFLKLMNNSVFEMEDVRKRLDIKLVKTDKKRKQVSQLSYYIKKWFSEDLLAIEIKKIKVKMNKPV